MKLDFIKMDTTDFYARIPTINTLVEITEPKKFYPVPDDWYIIITDIADSTKAIENGRYKEVNLLGASSIVAILNIVKKVEIPFVFGGDGASILVPPSYLPAVKDALVTLQYIARSSFSLNLRVGVVPMSAIASAGFDIQVAKLRISRHYAQAIFSGGGISYATELIKDYGIPNIYQLKRRKNNQTVDFTGLECRWQDIQPKHEEAVSLHVLAIGHAQFDVNQIYREVLDKIQDIYGRGGDLNPILSTRLNLSFSQAQLTPEAKMLTQPQDGISQWLYLCRMRCENLLGTLFMQLKLTVEGVDWGNYKTLVANTIDYQKFDDALRIVLSGNAAQSQALTDYLDRRYAAGELVYGAHISDRVLMTCLVFERIGRQVHFIDGADGGFALAARDLKQRMHNKALNWQVFLTMMRLRNRQ